MKKLITTNLIFLVLTILACKNTPESSPAVQANPLSIEDPKVGLNPAERYGDLYDSVQKSGLFPDPKLFWDYTPTTTTDSILVYFKEAIKQPSFSLQQFVSQYFMPPKDILVSPQYNGAELPEDYLKSLLTFLSRSADTADLSTKIPLPKPYVLPYHNAREMSYETAYFTMLGLQAAGKVDDLENMVNNFLHLINTFGYVPSGNRTYLTSRSQPPYFTCMVQLLAEAKNDNAMLVKYADAMEKEYNFWMKEADPEPPNEHITVRRVVHLDRNTLNRYRDDEKTPRAEAYRADKDTAKNSNREPDDTYRQIRSGAESGWQFSSRWLDDPKRPATIHATDFLPIDLNALLYNMEWTLARAKAQQKNVAEATKWEKKASSRREAMMRYCWSMTKGMFFDFDHNRYKQAEVVSAATVFPLYFRMVTKKDADKVAANIRSELLKAGGIVTTNRTTGQAWDAPFGCAQLQWMAIQGLRNYGHEELANDIKNRWVALNIKVLKSTGRLLEKYNVQDLSLENGGDSLARNYGATSGVLLKLLSER
jgi:alpha,alpha-trehalase